MSAGNLVILLLALSFYAYFWGYRSMRRIVVHQKIRAHSRNRYYGLFLACRIFFPAFFLILLWQFLSPLVIDLLLQNYLLELRPLYHFGDLDVLIVQVQNIQRGLLPISMLATDLQGAVVYYDTLLHYTSIMLIVLSVLYVLLSFYTARHHLVPQFEARHYVEKMFYRFMLCSAFFAVLVTVGIIASLLFETVRFLQYVPLTDFLFGLHWSPQMAIREDQVGSSGAFGIVPLLWGTFMITLIAMCIAVPIGIMSAVYLSEYALPKQRNIIKPLIEVLAGIPTVVYGFFAVLFIAPYLRRGGALLGFSFSSESALAAGFVMGIMIIPFVSSLSDDVMRAVPQNLRDGAVALGSTKSEVIKKVVLPSAFSGIVSAVLLGISRAIGETMIVVMATGVMAHLTLNPFESVTTMTVQIVSLLTGDQEFDSPKTLAAFALGMVLFFVTLGLNIFAVDIVRRYREQYD